jgi:hypothetical protein
MKKHSKIPTFDGCKINSSGRHSHSEWKCEVCGKSVCSTCAKYFWTSLKGEVDLTTMTTKGAKTGICPSCHK